MPTAVDHANRFLSAHGLTLEHVARSIGDLPPSETVVFGGSVCEGLANATSDLDLLLIGDSDIARGGAGLPQLEAGDASIAFQRDLGPFRVQIERVRPAHLERIAEQMAETAESFHHPERAERVFWFGELDTRTLHRIRTGIALRHAHVADEWRTRLASEFLPTYMLATMAAQHSNLMEDAVGEARAGRPESALWALRYALGFAAAALLASCGETNPNAKWWVRLLQLNRETVGCDLADALVRHMTGGPVTSFDEHLDDVRQLCERVVTTAVASNPVVHARRRTMLARARAAGVALPGSRRPQSDRV
jgi:hypothetical protein